MYQVFFRDLAFFHVIVGDSSTFGVIVIDNYAKVFRAKPGVGSGIGGLQ